MAIKWNAEKEEFEVVEERWERKEAVEDSEAVRAMRKPGEQAKKGKTSGRKYIRMSDAEAGVIHTHWADSLVDGGGEAGGAFCGRCGKYFREGQVELVRVNGMREDHWCKQCIKQGGSSVMVVSEFEEIADSD